MITKVANNLNKTCSVKYGFTSNQVEEISLEGDSYIELYDFHRLVRVKYDEGRLVRYKERKGDRKKKS